MLLPCVSVADVITTEADVIACYILFYLLANVITNVVVDVIAIFL